MFRNTVYSGRFSPFAHPGVPVSVTWPKNNGNRIRANEPPRISSAGHAGAPAASCPIPTSVPSHRTPPDSHHGSGVQTTCTSTKVTDIPQKRRSHAARSAAASGGREAGDGGGGGGGHAGDEGRRADAGGGRVHELNGTCAARSGRGEWAAQGGMGTGGACSGSRGGRTPSERAGRHHSIPTYCAGGV